MLYIFFPRYKKEKKIYINTYIWGRKARKRKNGKMKTVICSEHKSEFPYHTPEKCHHLFSKLP